MTFSIEIIATIMLAVLSFVIGKLWNHSEKIQSKVNWRDCQEHRKNCPCQKDINNIKESLKK